jgi:1,2-phenylacetyl-CoA epoxidase PaaB subunit
VVSDAVRGHYDGLAYYEVFARHAKDPTIQHLGVVRAVDPDDAEVYAYTMYDERRWAELFVVPRASMVTVVAPD